MLHPEEEWAANEQGVEFMTSSSRRWCAADVAAGAEPAAAEAAAARTAAFYASG